MKVAENLAVWTSKSNVHCNSYPDELKREEIDVDSSCSTLPCESGGDASGRDS